MAKVAVVEVRIEQAARPFVYAVSDLLTVIAEADDVPAEVVEAAERVKEAVRE